MGERPSEGVTVADLVQICLELETGGFILERPCRLLLCHRIMRLEVCQLPDGLFSQGVRPPLEARHPCLKRICRFDRCHCPLPPRGLIEPEAQLERQVPRLRETVGRLPRHGSSTDRPEHLWHPRVAVGQPMGGRQVEVRIQLRGPHQRLHAGHPASDHACHLSCHLSGLLGWHLTVPLSRPSIGRRRRSPEDLLKHGQGIGSMVRGMAGEDGVQSGAQRVDIRDRPYAVKLAPGLLRRHGCGRAGDLATPGRIQLPPGTIGHHRIHVPGDVLLLRRSHHSSQSPVHHQDFTEGTQHHVRGLEVSMHHTSSMGVGDRLAGTMEGLDHAAECPSGRSLEILPGFGSGVELLEGRLERLAMHLLHGEIGPRPSFRPGVTVAHAMIHVFPSS